MPGMSTSYVAALTWPAAYGSDYWMVLCTQDPGVDLSVGYNPAGGPMVDAVRMEGVLPVRCNLWALTLGGQSQQIYNLNDILFDPVAPGSPVSQTVTHIVWMGNGFISEANNPMDDWSLSDVAAVTPLTRPMTYGVGQSPVIPAGMAVVEVTAEQS